MCIIGSAKGPGALQQYTPVQLLNADLYTLQLKIVTPDHEVLHALACPAHIASAEQAKPRFPSGINGRKYTQTMNLGGRSVFTLVPRSRNCQPLPRGTRISMFAGPPGHKPVTWTHTRVRLSRFWGSPFKKENCQAFNKSVHYPRPKSFPPRASAARPQTRSHNGMLETVIPVCRPLPRVSVRIEWR